MKPIHEVELNDSQRILLKSLVYHQVNFLVIGGQAVCKYSNYRQTKDLDILLSKSKNNAEKVVRALQLKDRVAPSGLPFIRELTQPNKLIAYPTEGKEKEADILTSINGIEFVRCFQNSSKTIFSGIEARVPSIYDLIEMKKISAKTKNLEARKQDEEDIDELMRLIASSSI